MTEHAMKVVDLSTRKLWSACVEYDILYRFAIYNNVITWGQSHGEAYEAAFTDKVNGAAKTATKLSCSLCGGEHETLGPGCIFRGGDVGGDSSGRPKGWNKFPKSKGGGGGGGDGGDGTRPKNPTPSAKGDSRSKRREWLFDRVDGKQLCYGYSDGTCTGKVCSKNPNFVHLCQWCKGPHSMQHCAKRKADGW